jgi:hypothetical protein
MMLLWVMMIGVWAGGVLLLAFDPFRAASVEACDRAVHLLLTTDSMVELDRSKYLIRKLDCSVRRRLRAEGASP